MADMVADITQKIEGIVGKQAQICSAKTATLETELAHNTEAVRELRQEMAALRDDLSAVKTANAVQNVRIGIFAAVGASVPTIALGVMYILSK